MVVSKKISTTHDSAYSTEIIIYQRQKKLYVDICFFDELLQFLDTYIENENCGLNVEYYNDKNKKIKYYWIKQKFVYELGEFLDTCFQ